MRKLWVVLLAVPIFALGAFLATAYQGAVGGLAGFRITCEVLNSAESAGLFTKTQRADVVERSIDRMRKATPKMDEAATRLLEEFKAGCPALPNF